MKTTLDIDLASILEQKYPHGFHVPVDIDLSAFLEFADDDWSYDLDLDELLERDGKAAIVFSSDEAKAVRPHLTDEEAWDVAKTTRDEFRDALGDFLGDVADMHYPSGKAKLKHRLFDLKLALQQKEPGDSLACQLLQELTGLDRLIDKIPDSTDGNPGLEGAIAATLDDVAQAFPNASNGEA